MAELMDKSKQHAALKLENPARRLALLTDDDVCEMFRVRKSYLRDLRSQKRIPFLKLGNLVRYRAEELESWINSGASARTSGAEVSKAIEQSESNGGPYVHREKKNW